MLTIDFDFPRPVSPLSRTAIFPTLSSKTTGDDVSGVFILDKPMHVPFAFANKAFQELSLEANTGLNDVAATSDAKASFNKTRILSGLNSHACLSSLARKWLCLVGDSPRVRRSIKHGVTPDRG
jgi:hypothetical protein